MALHHVTSWPESTRPIHEGAVLQLPSANDYYVSISGNGFGVRAGQLDHLLASHDFGRDASMAIRQLRAGEAVTIIRGSFSMVVSRPLNNVATVRKRFVP